ncbi:MAG: hypothetical protein QUT30_05720 [Acidobacteriota bacterium]|jgi:hypothetical protein|nr:hypothetical protein [Acidobacteriota bacterium]
MMTPSEIWPMIVASAAVVFGAGQLVEKIRNGKYVSRDMCAQIHKREDERWTHIEKNLDRIWRRLNNGYREEDSE